MRQLIRGHASTALALVLATSALATPAGAQGALSLLGFGYPNGGASTRSLGTGTSLIGLDAQSSINPASIVLSARLQGYLQFEPELRSVSAGGPNVKTTSVRFPLFMVTGRQSRATFSLSYSSFMDRTWSNSYADTQSVGSERIPSVVLTSSVGGIADVRGAVAWTFSERVHVGIGAHFYPGENRVVFGRAFSDSSRAGSFQVQNAYNFSGSALSFGGVWLTPYHLQLAADMRVGGNLRMRLGDSTLVGEGTVPFRAGVTLSYDGIPGSVFSVRLARERWTDMRGLGTSSLGLEDATDMAIGAEVLGPRLGANQVAIRAGYRNRGLPFTFGTTSVSERTFSGGVGIPIGGSRALLDVGIARATRTASSVTEKAWLVSLGVGIRP